MEQVLQEENVQIKLPKNVRQIGTIDKNAVIYIEDYVVTYLNQMAGKEKLSFGAAALYGRTVFEGNEKYVFISAAVFEEDRPAMQSTPNDVIDNGPTKSMLSVFHENEEKYFSELTPVGIAIIHKDSVRIPDAWTRKSKLGNLLGRGAVMIDLCADGDGAEYYFYNEEGIVPQEGHYVYYEKNDIMQSFLVEWHENAQTGLSEEPLDFVAGTCRMVMDDKKEDKLQERSVNWVSASGILSLIVISAIGIIVMNHYNGTDADKMTAMPTSELSVSVDQTDTASVSDTEVPEPQSGSETPDTEDPMEPERENGQEQTTEQLPDPAASAEGKTDQESDADMETGEDATEASSENVSSQETPVTSDAAAEIVMPMEYTIEKGDTLYDISRRYYGTIEQVPSICEYNHIEDQDSIFYGQTIVLP